MQYDKKIIDYYYGDIDGVWNASLALSIVGPGLPWVEKQEKSTASPDPRFIVHRKQQSLAFTIARRQTDLDCPSKITMIADCCSSFKVQERHARKTRENR